MSTWYDPFGLYTNDPSEGYKKAGEQFQNYANQAKSYQQPFYDAGVNSIAPYQASLNKMADPQEYFNSIMSGYSSSPYAKYEQQNAMNAATNSASASGMTGSTPLMMQEEQTASDISSKDMDQYFADILGINKDYLTGLDSLIKGGQGSANSMTNLFSNLGQSMGGLSFAGTEAQRQQKKNMLNMLLMAAFL